MSQQPVMVVTGATSGIGQAAAIELARRGAQVGVVARDARKAEATVDRIRVAALGAPVDVFIGDLSLMADVAKLATGLLDRYERIDVLVNNAGIQLPEQRTTSEGLPEMVAVNYLAPWLLTALLRDRLVASARRVWWSLHRRRTASVGRSTPRPFSPTPRHSAAPV